MKIKLNYSEPFMAYLRSWGRDELEFSLQYHREEIRHSEDERTRQILKSNINLLEQLLAETVESGGNPSNF